MSSAIVLGLCLAMSSTAMVMQLLEDEGRSATPVGRIALSVLLFQDLMVAPVLFGVGVLGRGDQHAALALAGALLQAAVAVAVIIAVGRYLLRPIFRFAGQTGSRELILAMTLFMVIGMAAATGPPGSRPRSAPSSPACCSRRPNTAIRSRSIWRRSRAC